MVGPAKNGPIRGGGGGGGVEKKKKKKKQPGGAKKKKKKAEKHRGPAAKKKLTVEAAVIASAGGFLFRLCLAVPFARMRSLHPALPPRTILFLFLLATYKVPPAVEKEPRC